MLRTFAKNHKIITTCLVGTAVASLPLVKAENRVKFNDFRERMHRTTFFARNIAYIVGDYWYSFRKLEYGTPEEAEMEHVVNLRSAQRLYRMCDHLGGYFAKFGQMVSSLGNGIPEEYVQVLSKCQDSLTPVDFGNLTRVIKEDLGVNASDVFLEVDQKPVGCASLAQVHRATLKNGEEVAVKIQYPTVAKNTQVDLRNIEYATRLCERIFPRFQFSWVIPKFRSQVETEFNFLFERDNLQDCRDFFSTNPSVYIPKVYPELCSKRLVVMEYCDGVKVNDKERIQEMGLDIHEVGHICIEAFSDMIFRFNKLHMDPHAGNLFVRPIPNTNKPQVVILDHGMYMQYRESFKSDFQKLWLAMISQDQDEIRECCKPWGMEEYSEVLTIVFTGRGSQWNNKLGEQMSEEEMEKMREKMRERMKNMPIDKEKMEERMLKMQRMMKVIPIELISILRVQMMMSNLLRSLGCSENERLTTMTDYAIRSMYVDENNRPNYFLMLRWKFYLAFLKIKLFWNDLVVDLYYRWYLQKERFSFPSLLTVCWSLKL